MTPEQIRASLISFFQRDLVGPAHGEEETLEERASLRYSAGVLFSQETVRDESTEINGMPVDREAKPRETAGEPIIAEAALLHSDVGDSERADRRSGDEREETGDDIITLANTFKPSAVGISFACSKSVPGLTITAQAALYESVLTADQKRQFKRRPLTLDPFTFTFSLEAWQRFESPLTDGLVLRVIVRRRNDGSRLCTASLFNTTHGESGRDFFQTAFTVRSSDGSAGFLEYRPQYVGTRDLEERTLAMLYRNRRTFAVGHGCAPDWVEDTPGLASEVRTATIPVVRVPPVLPTGKDEPWLNMQRLSGDGMDDDEILKTLEQLPAAYDSWIENLVSVAAALDKEYAGCSEEQIALCRRARDRMRAGIALLRRDDFALRSFKLMNRVMLQQQEHSKRRRSLDDEWKPFPERYESVPGQSGFWRTFQIAFVLMVLPGLGPESEDAERELVDLIWFSTGGGKTEAYLAVSAFLLFRRRLARKDDGGCAIIMRYTLRLLTSQQFQRAASLIAACELVRRESPASFGNEPFSIGLWVGSSLTPNRNEDARRDLRRMAKDSDAANPFQLLSCPWCGTELNNRKRFGYVESGTEVIFRCPADGSSGGGRCPFSTSAQPLPVAVVDEAVYKRPPSLIIGTVDKYAMLAWRPEARALFGTGNNTPPELIIQDELHLISGPLGSLVGIYEGAIDLLCQRKDGRRAKVIASTATIRRAKEQCRALFDREMFQFPPQGLEASDSFFAQEDPKAAGRFYLGFLPTAASSPLTAQIRSVAALLQGLPLVATGAEPSAVDPYYTLVQYFSSLKELGRGATLATADIPEYLPAMQRRYGLTNEQRRWVSIAEELTSRKSEDEIPKILKELERSYDGPAERGKPRPIDTLLATNMISVGVDVDRLGLMMVVTQPKSTSEYIQASSRVGRSRRGPGLVITLYNAGRPRDRSHYEQFRSYHEAFYRFVEPTSVTPYSTPALERALHGVMVLVARQIAGVSEPSKFRAEQPAYTNAINFLRARVARLDPERVASFDAWHEKRIDEWARLKAEEFGGFGPREKTFLMRPAGEEPPGGDWANYRGYWVTPTSMRNVDAECGGFVVNYEAVGT
jgi:hypothetical protein